MEKVAKNKKSVVLVNIGCGPIGHDDWINLDYGILAFLHRYSWLERLISKLNLWPKPEGNTKYNIKWPKNLRLINCKKGLPFKENSVDYIFTSHFLEHLKRFEAMKVLRSCYKCLKPGGTIRIVVPDLDIIVQQYINNPNKIEKVDIINDQFFAKLRQETTPPSLYDKIQTLFTREHQWMYNFDYLKEMLVKVGFNADSIVRCKPKQGRVPNLDVLDCYEDESVFLEATK